MTFVGDIARAERRHHQHLEIQRNIRINQTIQIIQAAGLLAIFVALWVKR